LHSAAELPAPLPWRRNPSTSKMRIRLIGNFVYIRIFIKLKKNISMAWEPVFVEAQLSLTNRTKHLCNVQWLEWPAKTCLPLCCRAEFDCSTSNAKGLSREVPKIGSSGAPPLRMWRVWPPINTPLPVIMPNLIAGGQTNEHSYGNQQIRLLASSLSRSLKVIIGSIGHLRLPINVPSNHGYILYLFPDMAR